MNPAGLRIACWRTDAGEDAQRIAAAARLAVLFPGQVTLVFAGAPLAETARAAARAAGLAVEQSNRPADIDLVLALGPDEPGLALDAPAVVRWPTDMPAPAGALGVCGNDSDELGEALAFLALDPDLRRGLRRERLAASALPPGAWRVEGPFDSSFSLAIVNRELAVALDRLGLPAALGSPLYRAGRTPDWGFLADRPAVSPLFARGDTAPAVVLANDYPPEAAALPRAPLALLANYAWEESGYPAAWAREFNWRLDALTVCSPLTKKILRDAGVKRPIAVVGNGVEQLAEVVPMPPPGIALGTPGRFRFLHVSSCLPRKGVDVLLEAYGRAFSATDPVTLVIKSVPGEANVAPACLARLKATRTDFPEVVLIDADLPDAAVAWLYTQCQVFVLTPRAEGFGLPIAEAALYGLPTVTSAFGGQRCLVDETTGFLIPGRFERSGSHLGIADSLWFEPDAAALAATLRRVAAMPAAELAAYADRLKVRLLATYGWPAVARRTRQAVETVWQRPWLARQPKVGWISTWNSRCGIATYSQHLTALWPTERLFVLANRDAEPLGAEPDAGPTMARVWSRDDFDAATLAESLLRAGCEAVVAQHHPGLFSASALGALAERLAAHGIRTYATLHNTAQLDAAAARTLTAVHRLLVHTADDLNRLWTLGLAERATLFPHGIYPRPAAAGDLPERLGLAGKRIVATFGFLMPHKGLAEVLEAFAALAPRHPDLHLLMLNATFPAAHSFAEAERLATEIRARRLTERVTLVTDFLPDAHALTLLATADTAVFAYQNTDESASGAVRMAIAAGCPVLATPLPIFADVAEAVSFLPGRDPAAIAAGLEAELARLSAPEARQAARERVAGFAAARLWPLLGERLLNMIDGDANDPFPDSLFD